MEEELSANAQKITAEMQYEIRKTIVRMLKKGMKGNEIAKILDVSKGHVSNVKKAYAENGIKGIKPNIKVVVSEKKEFYQQIKRRKSKKS